MVDNCPVGDFCAHEKVNRGLFYYWKVSYGELPRSGEILARRTTDVKNFF